jgi:hypothetical protein
MDDQMIETFETLENETKARLMKNNTWGTEAGYQEFNMERLQAWQDTVSQYLPTPETSPQNEED